MLICKNCGSVFHEDSLKNEWYGDEVIGVCPSCHMDDIADGVQCKCCGEWFEEDDIIGGAFCEDCISDAITHESFLEFGLEECEDCETSTFEWFMLEYFGVDMSVGIPCMMSSSEWKKALEFVYKEKVVPNEFSLDYIKRYVLKHYKTEFAEYLERKELKK